MHRASFAVLCLAGVTACSHGQLPTNIAAGTITVRTSLVATVQGAALDMALRPDDPSRFFVATKDGVIHMVSDGTVAQQPFLSLTSGFGLIASGERGLLGMSFHPGFNTPGSPGFGKFYTYTSEVRVGSAEFFLPANGPTGGSHHNVVREWTVDPNAASVSNVGTASRVLFRSANPASNHNAGAIKFGPDGMLYVSLGDGALPRGSAQDLSLILGKVIRIDPTAANPANGRYGIPADNPFAADGDPGLDEIYAYGLRNPFRMSFDRLNGDLYLGDVGEGLIEEVDKITAGGNYGWPYFEGTSLWSIPAAGFSSINPLAQYSRAGAASIIGGFVYRGSDIPELYGKYVFADAYLTQLRYMEATGGQIYELNVAPGPVLTNGIYGWGEDASGELYALRSNGSIVRISAVPEPAGTLIMLGAIRCVCARRRQIDSRIDSGRLHST